MHASSLDLSKIYSHPVLRSRSSAESQKFLCQTIAEHRLRWGHGDVDTALYRRKLGQIELLVLKYGAEVEVSPEAFDDFTLVQVPLQGVVDIEADGKAARIGSGEIAVLSPRRNARIHWQAGCQQLIVKMPDALVKAEAPLAMGAVWHMPVFKVTPDVASRWLGLLQQMLALLPPSGEAASQPWLVHLEHTLALYLRGHQPCRRHDDACDAGLTYVLEPGAAGRHRMDRLEAHIGRHLFAPLSLPELADAVGVTTRTLSALCQKYRGLSPMHLVRNLRLDEARRELLSTEARNVTEIAVECGFGHLGRFSAYYKERFGELPRETARYRQ